MTFIDVSGKNLLNIEGWQVQYLGDLISLEYGASLSEAVRVDGEYPVYGSNGQIGKHTTFLIGGPGIIVGRKGTVGAVIWSDNSFWPIDTTYYVNLHKNCDLRWCYWQLLSLPMARLDSSTGVPGLNRNDVYKLWLNLPSPSEQSIIAHILDTLDTQIQQTEHLIAKLKQMKVGLLHDLLTKGIDENGDVRDPVAHPEEFKNTKIGSIPATWDILSGHECSDLITKGESPNWQGFKYEDDGILFITSENVRDGFLNIYQPKFISTKFDKKIQRSRLQKNDVLINLVGASIGRSCLVPPSVTPANINQAVCLLRPKPTISSSWIVNYLQLPEAISRLLGKQVETARANLSLSLIGKFHFPCPSYPEQKQISSIIDAFNANIYEEATHLAKLKQLKKGLMHDLLTGRVRVTSLLAESEQLDVQLKSVSDCK